MNENIRGYELLKHNEVFTASLLWQEIEKAVCSENKIKPFDPIEPEKYDNFKYLQSQSVPTRFELIDGHSRYQVDPGSIQSILGASGVSLGSVETDVLSFSTSPNPQLCVLVGGTGSGKSTTLKFLQKNHFNKIKVILCNFDAIIQTDMSDSEVVKVFVRQLSHDINKLITPEEEYRDLWSWGLSPETGCDHTAKNILSSSEDILRYKLGNNWLSDSEDAIRIRKDCHQQLIQNHFDNLTYQALRIDYYLTHQCKGDRSKFLLILDNVDPLPPQIQFQLKDIASRLQVSAHCKVLLSMRPLTYSSNFQSAQRMVEVIEHIGPSVIDLIKDRVTNYILKTDMPGFEVNLSEDGYGDYMVKQDKAKEWVEEVLNTLTKQETRRVVPLGEPQARTFVEGICGHSLRNALILAPKIFGSMVIPILPVIGTDQSRSRKQHVRDQEVIRAILDGWHCHFQSSPGRVTDNVFDLGGCVTSQSCTCKIRLLKKLASSNTGIVTLGELRTHLSSFGYANQIILDTVNSVIAQTKRLALSDAVADYKTLDGFSATKIKISSAGIFYIRYAIFNLEYVQGMHLDTLMPKSEVLTHDPRNFSDRARSLELFLRYLNKQDYNEVLRILNNNAASDYNTVYEGSLFSVGIIEAIARQIEKVGQSLFGVNKSKLGYEKQNEIQNTIERWQDLAFMSEETSSSLVKKLTKCG